MRLFQKTLFLFIAVIMFQAFLTNSFITRTISKSQAVDARRELTREASSVYDNFNYWKLLLWKQINILREDETLRTVVPEGTDAPFSKEFVASVQRASARAAVEFAVLKREDPSRYEIISVSGTNQPFLDAEVFVNRKEYPYIDMIQIHNSLYFTGIVRIPDAAGTSYIDVFLVKLIDRSLLAKLSSNQRIQVLLSTTGGFSDGTVSFEGLPDRLFNDLPDTSYTTVDGLEVLGEPHSAVIQHSGTVHAGDASDMLSIIVLFSHADYHRQVEMVNRTVLTISLVVAAAAILLSLVFSGRITSPIRRLLGAMHKIKGGEYNVAIPTPGKGEIGELMTGFNEMAGQLSRDKTELDKHFRQIVQLQVYNEKIINAIREGLVVLNEELVIEKANQSFLELFSITEETAVGSRVSDLPIGIVDNTLIREMERILSERKAPPPC